MSNNKKKHKFNIGISTCKPSVDNGKIQPWPKKPSVVLHLLQISQLILALLFIITARAFCITTNWNQVNPSPIGKDLAINTPENRPNQHRFFSLSSNSFDLEHPPDPPYLYRKLVHAFTDHPQMSGRRGKREKSASPAKRAGARQVDEDGDAVLNSPPKNTAKRMFTGAKAMDEDFNPTVTNFL